MKNLLYGTFIVPGLLFFCCMSVFAQAAPSGNTYYVRPGGTGDGTGPASHQAWGQLSQAAAQGALSPGDTVYVAPGIYNEHISALQNFGTSDTLRVKYLGDPQGTHFSDIGPGKVIIYNDDGMHLWNGTFVNIENFTIIGSGSGNVGGITPAGAQSIVIRNNIIKGYKAAIPLEDQGAGPCQDIIIEDNQIIENTQYGIWLWGGSYGTMIRNNIIRDNGNQGIKDTDVNNEVSIYNNTFYNNGTNDWGGDTEDHLSIYSALQVNVKNNIFYSSLPGRQTIGEYGTGTYDIDYNLYYSSLGDPIHTPGMHFIDADPQFVNAGGNDFHLQSGSPAVDTGLNLADVTQDFENNSRPLDGNNDGIAETDIGAYENSHPLCLDSDGDGYGNPGHPLCPAGSDTDCDDSDAFIYPGVSPVRIKGGNYYDTIQNAYNAASDGNILEVLDEIFMESLSIYRNISISMGGGFDCAYLLIKGVTIINGNTVISDGVLMIHSGTVQIQ